MYISPLIKTSVNCTTPHLHWGVGVVVDGSDGSDVETAGPLPMEENMQGKVNKYIYYTV